MVEVLNTSDSGAAVLYAKVNEIIQALNEATGGTASIAWGDVTGKPAVIAAGADQASARTAIGAGTSNLAIGTTATTALKGDTAIPSAATMALTGFTAGTAGAVSASDTVNAALAKLEARLVVLETV